MNRRTYLAIGGSLFVITSAGCIDGNQTAAELVVPPDVSAEDYRIEDPSTIFKIEWNVSAATRVDLDQHDGRSISAIEGMMYLFIQISVTNVGKQSHRFVPAGLVVDGDGERYRKQSFHHISNQFSRRGVLNPEDTSSGWLAYEIPRNVESVTIRLSEEHYVNDPAVKFERNTSLEPPI